MKNDERHVPSKGLELSAEGVEHLKSRMPHLAALFANLEVGMTPSFLDMIAALSEMVAFYTDCDQFDEVLMLLEERMSGKKCRFCS